MFPVKPGNTATRRAVLKPPVKSAVKGNTVQVAWQVIIVRSAPKVLCKVIQDKLLVPSAVLANSLMLMGTCRANYVYPIHITVTKEETAVALVVHLVGMLNEVVLGVNLVWLAKPASLVKSAWQEDIVEIKTPLTDVLNVQRDIRHKKNNLFVFVAI